MRNEHDSHPQISVHVRKQFPHGFEPAGRSADDNDRKLPYVRLDHRSGTILVDNSIRDHGDATVYRQRATKNLGPDECLARPLYFNIQHCCSKMPRLLALTIRERSWAKQLPNADIEHVTDIPAAAHLLQERGFDAVLYELGADPGETDLRGLHAARLDTPIIAVSRTEEHGFAAIQAGAHVSMRDTDLSHATVEEAIALARQRLDQAKRVDEEHRKHIRQEIEQNIEIFRDALFLKVDKALATRLASIATYLAEPAVNLKEVRAEVARCQQELDAMRQSTAAAISKHSSITRPINFTDFFTQVAKQFSDVASHRGLQLHPAIVPCEIEADSLALSEVLEHALMFAKVLGPHSAPLRVIGIPDKRRLTLTIEMCAPRMTDPSMQLAMQGLPAPELSNAPGAEIHLLSARKSLERMGGSALLKDNMDRAFTDLVLEIPRRAYANPHTVNILYTEDQPQTQALVHAVLRRSGWPVRLTAVPTLAETRQALGSGGFDLWLVDLHLPDAEIADVFELIAEWKRLVPVVVLTGDGTPGTASEAERSGVRGFLTKDNLTDQGLLESLLRSAVVNRQVFEMLKPLRP